MTHRYFFSSFLIERMTMRRRNRRTIRKQRGGGFLSELRGRNSTPPPPDDTFSMSNPMLHNTVPPKAIEQMNATNAPVTWSEGNVGANIPEQNTRIHTPNYTVSTSRVSDIIRQRSQKQSTNRRKSWAEPVHQPWQGRASIFSPILKPATDVTAVTANPSRSHPLEHMGVATRRLPIDIATAVAAGGARAKTRRRHCRSR